MRRNAKRLQQAQIRRTRKLQRWKMVIAAIGILFVMIVFMMLKKTFNSSQISNEFYFVDSRYQGIKSQFDNKKSPNFKSEIEYPITDNDLINQRIKNQVEILSKDFFEQVKLTPQLAEPATQNISYQVYLNDQQFLSLAIFIHQDMRGAHPGAHTLFWTFDKKTGQPVTISQLFDNKRPAIDNFLNTIKTAVRQQVKNTQLDDEYFKQALGDGTNLSFIAKDKQTIEFLFGRGTVGPQSAGEIGVNVKVNTFKAGLQNQLAKSLFDIQTVQPPAPNPPKPTEKVIALTYDDGPGAHTGRLLDILRDKQAKATFYVIGRQVPTHADLIKRIIAEQHEIGNHTWDHPNLSKLTVPQVEKQLTDTTKAIKNAEPQAQVRTVRPPYGAYSQGVLDVMARQGLSNLMWSVDTRDWADRKADVVCNRAVTSAQPGAIILLHDIHGSSVDATPCIIDALKKAGYKLVTVSELFGGQLKPGLTYSRN